MGFLDIFTGKGGKPNDRGVSKQVARLVNQNVQHEDRLRSAEVLAQLGSEDAVYGLLRRFDMTLDKTYQDQAEKKYVKDLVVSKGEAAIPAITRFLKDSDNINWPVRILSTILDNDEAVVTALLHAVESERDSGDMKGPKRAKLLSVLIQYEDPRIAETVASFLHDFDESVRFTAVEVLDKQGHDSVRDRLVQVMTGPDEESVRVRRRILEAFARHGWGIQEWKEQVEAWLPEGFAIRGDRIVEV